MFHVGTVVLHLRINGRSAGGVSVQLFEQQRLHPRHNLGVILFALLSLVEQLQRVRDDRIQGASGNDARYHMKRCVARETKVSTKRLKQTGVYLVFT